MTTAMIPVPTPDQAVHVLEILEQWTKRGWYYEVRSVAAGIRIDYQDPEPRRHVLYSSNHVLGVNHFDALCQATTVMQVLLEEHPEKP